MKKSTHLLLAVIVAACTALVALAVWSWLAPRNSGRDEMLAALLHEMPAETSGVLYVDAVQLRQATFAQKLFAWAPQPQADTEYARFVQQTSFNYERDLQRVAFAAAKHGTQSVWFAIADGAFDEKKIAAYAVKIGSVQKHGGHGSHDIYSITAILPASPDGSTASLSTPSQISFTFLSGSRIAASNDGNLAADLAQSDAIADPAPWRTRFKRLAGSPIFIVVRQDGNAANSLTPQAPGGFQSPQLSALLGQLSWLTLAAQADGDALRIVAEGETASDTVAGQLADMLNGVLILAQAGLNGAKTTQQLDPQTRAAYLELLKSADITRVDRDELKAVRVVFDVTPNFLNAVTLPEATPTTAAGAAPTPRQPKTTSSSKTPAPAEPLSPRK